jgi:hypothetical protein
MYKIVIWGTGNTARQALDCLSDGIEIAGFCDNNTSVSRFENFEVLNWKDLNDLSFDYILICSIYFEEILKQLIDYGIARKKVLVYSFWKSERYRIYKEDFFKTKYKKMVMKGSPEVMISGISYHNDGIDENTFGLIGKTCFNFALRAQDIFYDWKISELLGSQGFLKNTRYYIIGLSYYSFEYDLSKSRNSWEIIRYYPIIEDCHNLISQQWFKLYVEEIEKKIENDEIHYQLFSNRKKHEINEMQAKECAKGDFNKDYPVTVWENKKILKSFLSYLSARKIVPVIVVMPAVKEYTQCCSRIFIKEFYSNLYECLEGKNIQVLDYFGKYFGEKSDWYHITHFNASGAERFTKKLIKDIKWEQ